MRHEESFNLDLSKILGSPITAKTRKSSEENLDNNLVLKRVFSQLSAEVHYLLKYFWESLGKFQKTNRYSPE